MDNIEVPRPQTFFPVYHGSRTKGLTAIDPDKAGSGVVGYRNPFGAIFFSSEPDMASYYSDPVEEGDEKEMTYVCRVTMQNPLILEEEDALQFQSRSDEISYALSEGYDGLVIKDQIDGPLDVVGDVYVVFDPSQVEIISTILAYDAENNNEQ